MKFARKNKINNEGWNTEKFGKKGYRGYLIPYFFLLVFFWPTVWSYRHHWEVRDAIWDDDWSHSLSTLSYLRFSWFVALVYYHYYLDRRNTREKWPMARNPDGSWWHRHTNLKLFWQQLMSPWTQGMMNEDWTDHKLWKKRIVNLGRGYLWIETKNLSSNKYYYSVRGLCRGSYCGLLIGI